MALFVQRAPRWRELLASLAATLTQDPPGPFETVEVLVGSRGSARVLSQDLAAALPGGISAGLSFVTPSQWVRGLALRHGVVEELDAWQSVRGSVVASDCLEELAEEHHILGAHLNATGSAARRQQLSQRSMRLFRRYVEQAPAMVSRWMDGDDVDASGEPLPGHLGWQPALLRLVAERLEVDPVDVWVTLAETVSRAEHGELRVFAVPELATSQRALLAAAAVSGDVHVWQVVARGLPDWSEALAPSTQPPAAAAAPRVEVHGSHGPARAVEVLRDELTRRFEADPGLEPRDVVVVCEDPSRWRPHLTSAFAPVADDPAAHPGRRMPLRPGSALESNLVVEVVRRSLRLAESRATASHLSELLLLSPIAHRWRLGTHREELLELVSASGIRWGLDPHHRAQLEVPGITQNTWVRGLDRLLAGIAVTPESAAPLPVTGVGTVGTSDLELVGNLAELLSRLRRFNLACATPATAAGWVERVRQLLSDVVGCSFDDEWMLLQANSALGDLEEQLSAQPSELGRGEFTRLFEAVTREYAPRPTVGNGALQVIALGDLAHVDFRLVCLLGMGDGSGGSEVDSVDLGDDVADPRRLRLMRLLSHARAADELLVVSQTRDPLTDQEVAGPTTIAWLLRELGASGTTPLQHPLLSHSEANFTSGRSFDRRALAAARALRAADLAAAAPHVLRRRQALAQPHREQQLEVAVRDLTAFLKDPAREFLRSAAGVRMYRGPSLADEIPFVIGGLEGWAIRDRLLQSFKQGANPEQAAATEVQRELLPPGQIGRRMLAEPLEVVKGLWLQAWEDWSAEVVDHRVELEVGDVVVADTVRTRGGALVEVTASRGRATEVRPWLQQLVLAASGVPAPVVVHRLLINYGKLELDGASLAAPDAEAAKATLGVIARAFSQGRSRLVPLPQEPALAFAEELVAGTHRPKDWEVPSSDWRRSRWTNRAHQWNLFYGDVPLELFDDPAGPRDPAAHDGAGAGSAFASWAAAIYLPMITGGK